jgi:hypothetical protein
MNAVHAVFTLCILGLCVIILAEVAVALAGH